MFVNTLQYIEDEWLVIVDCIEKGIIPVLENTEHVRATLEVSLLSCRYGVWLTLFIETPGPKPSACGGTSGHRSPFC
jgi:hypothetical protein